MAKKVFMTGNEIVVRAALDAGSDFFCGYPITPTTEILTGWAKEAAKDKKLKFIQAEDETTSGFMIIGGALAGKKAWTATGGPGNILMQDPMAMAEAMRIPTVIYVGQRGGPSTGTVIYSQQEVNLTVFGGNGEGLRIVYSPSTLQEMYDFTIKAFDNAWRYRFPAFILGDGYLSKTLGSVILKGAKGVFESEPILLTEKDEVKNIRNCYSLESELNDILTNDMKDFDKVAKLIADQEEVMLKDAEIVIFAHGVVGGAAKIAVKALRDQGVKVGLFRPKTLRPFPEEALRKSVAKARRIVIAESAEGQFGRMVRDVLYGVTDCPIHELYRPALGITPEEIEEVVMGLKFEARIAKY